MARRWALLAVAGAGAVPAPELPVPLPVAAKAAGCGPADLDCVLGKLYAPSEEQAVADAELSRLPAPLHPPQPSDFEGLLQRGEGLFDVPLTSKDEIAILGSREGRLALVAFLQGIPARVLAVERDVALQSRALLALRRLRDFLNSFGGGYADQNEQCRDLAAKGECAGNSKYMAANCSRSCYNRTQPTSLHWNGIEVRMDAANLSEAKLVILEDAPRGPDQRDMAAWGQLSELAVGTAVWSPQPLPSAAGLAPLRRIPACHVYLRVPRAPEALSPKWPLTVEEASRLYQAAQEELQQLGALKLSGAVLSEGRFSQAAEKRYGARGSAGERLARAFGAPSAKLGSAPDWCRCRPRADTFEVGALSLLGMFLVAVPGEDCALPPCSAADQLLALATAQLRRQLLAGNAQSPDLPPQVLRDLGCLRLSDQRTLLHAALTRKDLQLARAALRAQGAGGLFCRDGAGRSALHFAAALEAPEAPAAAEAEEANNSGALQRRVTASEATEWVLQQMRANAPEMLTAVDFFGRTALFTARSGAALRALLAAPELKAKAAAQDAAGRGLLWHAAALGRTEIVEELLCTKREKGKPAKPKLDWPPASAWKEFASSPLVAAAQQLAKPLCDKAPQEAAKTLELLMSCGGFNQTGLNGSTLEVAKQLCAQRGA
ncbi:unnamed protein product [Effrenium voratum]|nr:unnamed protein product [Effrenium voratum]